MPEISRAGGTIFWQADGSADRPALLFSNSLGADLDLWLPQLAAARDHRVIRYDTRGHGRSTGTSSWTIDLLGEDALAVLDAAGVERADFVGISLGGLTGMWLGVHAPARVGKLLLANTGARIGTPETWNQRISAVQTEGLAAIADSVLARWFTPGFAASHPDTVARIRHTFVNTPPHGYIACCEALREADLRNQIAAITRPVLVVTGTHDLSTPPALGEFVRTRIEGARLIELDCAHISNVGQSEAFNRAMLDFLSD
jgi:3-oxoadipate enol-lactonase